MDFAIIKVIDTRVDTIVARTVTARDGNFYIKNITPGVYKLEISKPGYYKNILFDFVIEADRNHNRTIDLLAQKQPSKQAHFAITAGDSSKNSAYCFMIGNIEVVADGDPLIPENLVTSRKITSGEIEHMQASNLGDILNLVPGIEKSKNQGLANTINAAVRSTSISGTSGILESFGSKIVIDGVAITNDANALISGSDGIDLRKIPADNIESVEVISGVPSVEYGNFSNGLIKVQTKKSKNIQPLFKVKFNPDTKTASYSDGFYLYDGTFDFHINYGYSERNLRIDGDEYHRLYGQLNYQKGFLDDKLKANYSTSISRFFDSDKPSGSYDLISQRKGFIATSSLVLNYRPQKHIKYEALLSINLNHRDNKKERLVADQLRIPADTTVFQLNSTLSDTILPFYIAQKQLLGQEWNIKANLSRRLIHFSNQYRHQILTGLSTRYSCNKGEGVILDHLFNYFGPQSPFRSYSYDQYPTLNQISAFVQDKITGDLFSKKFNLMLGLRYNLFNPVSFNLSQDLFKTQHGKYLCPRFNFRLFINNDLRVRIGAGKSAKSISLAQIFRPRRTYSYLGQDSVLVTEVRKQENPDLQAYVQNNYEISIDWRYKKLLGLSLTGYYNNSTNRPILKYFPFGYHLNPDTTTSIKYAVYQNRGWRDNYGVELVVRTKRFYNLQFKTNLTYRYSKKGAKGTAYDSEPDISHGEKYWYRPKEKTESKILCEYQLNYINQRLATWVTLDIQHIPWEAQKYNYKTEPYAKIVNGKERIFQQPMRYWWDAQQMNFNDQWIVNLRISKALSQNTEISLYINNLFDNRALWRHPYEQASNYELNPQIYYGLELSTQW